MTESGSAPGPSGPPLQMGSTPAPSFDYDRHDMLSNIMGIQQTLGSIRTSIEYINRDIKDLRDRDLADVKDTLREQSAKLSGIDKKIYAAVIILSIIGPIVGFLLERLWPVVASAVGHTG